MALYLYQLAYTAESLAAQIKSPADRIEAVAKPLLEKAGGKLLAAGYSFGEYDLSIIYEAPDDQTAAAVALTAGAGGALKAAKTTKLMTGPEFVQALQKAQGLAPQYQPAR